MMVGVRLIISWFSYWCNRWCDVSNVLVEWGWREKPLKVTEAQLSLLLPKYDS